MELPVYYGTWSVLISCFTMVFGIMHKHFHFSLSLVLLAFFNSILNRLCLPMTPQLLLKGIATPLLKHTAGALVETEASGDVASKEDLGSPALAAVLPVPPNDLLAVPTILLLRSRTAPK